jgi:hypothetical protein
VRSIGRPGLGIPFFQPAQSVPEVVVVLLDAQVLSFWRAQDDETCVWSEAMGCAQISTKGRSQHADVAWVGQVARFEKDESMVVAAEADRVIHARVSLRA